MRSRYKHLFFDLDNTLLDFDYTSKRAFEDLLREFGKSNFSSYFIYEQVNRTTWVEFEKGIIDAKTLRFLRFERFLKEMDWEGDANIWNETYLNYVVQHSRWVEGAAELIQKLYNAKYPIHIITNGLREVQRPRIKLTGLERFTSSIVVSDEIQIAKPAKEFFDFALQQIGTPKLKEVLVIGDSYASDIRGAHNYGIDSCWFNKNGNFEEEQKNLHTYEVRKLEEIWDLI